MLPGEFRSWNGQWWWDIGLVGHWWSTSEAIDWAWLVSLFWDWDDPGGWDELKSTGYSVRCIRDESGAAVLPELNTNFARNIKTKSAIGGGDIFDEGAAPVNARGVVWSTSEYPSVEFNEGITCDGEGDGFWECDITGLTPETEYFVRAWASNYLGTSYGQQRSFSTLSTEWDEPVLTYYNTSEAAIVHRTGDIDNLVYGWPYGFDPFSGESTPWHPFPFYPEPDDPMGTDRITVISGYDYGGGIVDGYTWSTQRPDNLPVAIDLIFDLQDVIIQNIVIQMFVDDFQAGIFGPNYFQVSFNGLRIPIMEEVINALNQTGPIGKLITVQIPESYSYLFSTGNVSLFIADTINNVGDGFAIDFVSLLINPVEFAHTGTVKDEYDVPIEGASVTAAGMITHITNDLGYYELLNVPAGLVHVTASKSDYSRVTHMVDLVSGASVTRDFILPVDTGIPEELYLSGMNIPPVPDICFAASHLIVESDFVIHNGGSATFVTGPMGAILLQTGTVVESGGYLRAWIDGDENYCELPKAIVISEHAEAGKETILPIVPENTAGFRVYPNPTRGQFTLELSELAESSTINVEIFSLVGESIMNVELPQMKQYLFDLSAKQPGIYLIRVMRGNRMGIEKIIRL